MININKFIIFLINYLVLCLLSCRTYSFQLANCECGIRNDDVAQRIVGGEVAQEHVFPWSTAILKANSIHCGGSLINNRYILTAGHCVKWVNKNDLKVQLGIHRRTDTGQEYHIDRVILHEDFTSDFLHDTNDIALIRLDRDVNFNQNISPVCLPHPLSDYSGRNAMVSGWGRLASNGEPSNVLRVATVQVMSLVDCNKTKLAPHLADTMLCAYAVGKDACQGDSGGPLTYEREPSKIEQIGVVSWGLGCASPQIPGVYTKLTDFLDWIADHTMDATYCAIN